MNLKDVIRKIFSKKQIDIIGGFGGWFNYSGGISHSRNQTELLKAYQGWVYACVTIIANNVAKVPLRLYQKKDGKWIKIEDHPLIELFDNPDPLYTNIEIWRLLMLWLELTGNAYLYLPQNRLGVPAEIWPIPPDRMWVVPDSKEVIKGYLYRHGGKEIAFEREEILHFKYPNPGNVYYGMGTLEAAAYSYDIDLYMKKYSLNFFKNDATPRAVLETDQTLNEGTIDRLRKAWYKVYGGVEQAGKIAILQAGAKYKALQINPRDLDYLAGRKATREDILAIFGVPASKLGLVEDVNRANAEANDLTFQSEVVLPRLKLLEARLNKDLVSRFDTWLRLEFDNPVPADKEFGLKKQESYVKSGIWTINEVREQNGDEGVSWGEMPWMPFNLVQVGSAEQAGGAAYQPEEGKGIVLDAALSEAEKSARWRGFLAIHTPAETHFKATLRRLFKLQRAEVLENLERALKELAPQYDPALVDFILFSQSVWEDKFAEAADPHFKSMLRAGVEKALADLSIGDFEFDYQNPRVTTFLKQRKMRFSFEVNETTLEKLKAELVEGLNAGEAVTELAGRVNKIFDFAEGYRAERIARTETTIASNTGIFEAYSQTGIVKKKMWLTARDESVRSTHAALDGEVVELEGAFTTPSGDILNYPGDPQGSAAEIINCRCTLLPVIENG